MIIKFIGKNYQFPQIELNSVLYFLFFFIVSERLSANVCRVHINF